MSYFSDTFLKWLDSHADQLDQESGGPADILIEKVAEEGVFGHGLSIEYGGKGTEKTEVVGFLSELAGHSLTAAFASWGHRTFIENIVQSENAYARETWLPDLLTGQVAASTALSNATKFLSKIEELNVTISEENGRYILEGRLPWVTNVRSDKFVTIFVADFKNQPDRKPVVITVPSTAQGLSCSADLEFVSLQGANTAALTFDKVVLDGRWILSNDAQAFLAQTRAEFLGYQFGLAFGLADKSLFEVERTLGTNRSVLKGEWQEIRKKLNTIREQLYKGLNEEGYFVGHPRELFELRISIVDVVVSSLALELQASGGRGYFKNSDSGFIRRWNEGAFLPIVTPTAVQLRHILA